MPKPRNAKPTAHLVETDAEGIGSWRIKWPSTSFKEGKTYFATTGADGTVLSITTAARKRLASTTQQEKLAGPIREAIIAASEAAADSRDPKQLARDLREFHASLLKHAQTVPGKANALVVAAIPLRFAIKDRIDRLCAALGVEPLPAEDAGSKAA